ncbi:acyloxyacyl hydrolase [Natronospirillum operosum]|uniref:Acyloxyacyl hydrolase n=1 Tax=Natronospirillum operosum TaxID=2759953 RepID=A0A4Z0WBH1_9GAMM|nr:acyloxyacyl hydrolase [Natronospirillum operosum]TGG95492.1 acyloxyacyl hydrolase [Natronospirillum operosum]
MRVLALLLTLTLLADPVQADTANDRTAAYLRIFIGQVDVGRDEADSQYGLEWQSAERWSRFELTPYVGLLRTRHASHMLYAGVQRRTAIRQDGLGPALLVGFAPGLYHHGGNSDTDLGFPLQFKSSVGIDYEFPDSTRMGLHFSHISNASLADDNPGTELLTLKYGLNF